MPPSGYSHLLSHKDFIITLHQQNRTHQDIISHLKQDYNLEVSRSTLSRCLRKWNIKKYKKWEASDEIQILIKELFSRGLQDADILLIIKEKHPDSQLCIRQLRQIRQQLKLPQRRDNYESDEVQKELISTVQKDLDSGFIQGFGREHLYTHFRQQGHSISRDRLFKTVQLLDPDGIKRRLNDLQRHRGSYIVPGPNYLWSIDGYCKLQHWGIEIYAAIDTYSRYIRCFLNLSHTGLYQTNTLSDRIAFLAVYMPIIRQEVTNYVSVWNNHQIRTQRKRPDGVYGRPWKLYYHPDNALQYGLKPDSQVLSELHMHFENWDINEYLPLETKNWCQNQISQLGLSSGRVTAAAVNKQGERLHKIIYLQLRKLVHDHIRSQQVPILQESEKPTGAWDWLTERLQEHEMNFDNVMEMNIYDENSDNSEDIKLDVSDENSGDVKPDVL
ncbi:hypothetical protein PABG_12650 [Paracoccidioides brasiliensis Pb03]|nr:hypothetical protein PABG_12650 [Paracoccidioides brasiliensis Pb03]